MPLSADGILGFFDGTARRCEAFEHVSLAAVGPLSDEASANPVAAADAGSPRRFRGTLVPEVDGVDLVAHGAATSSSGGWGIGSGPARVIPTATAVPQFSSPSPSWWCSEAKGTLHICALPEAMWNSIAAVTSISAPSQRQLAFSSETPAFCTSRNQSFVMGGADSLQGTSTPLGDGDEGVGRNGRGRDAHFAEEELPEVSAFSPADDATDGTHTPLRSTQTEKRSTAIASRFGDPRSDENPRRRHSLKGGRASPSHAEVPTSLHLRLTSRSGSSGTVDEGEGIRLPDMWSNVRQQLSSSAFCSDSAVHGAELRATIPQGLVFQVSELNASEALAAPQSVPSTAVGVSATDVPSIVIANPRNAENGNLSLASSVVDEPVAAGTVTVLLWVAVDASSAGSKDTGVLAKNTVVRSAGKLATLPSPCSPSNDRSAHKVSSSVNGGATVTSSAAATAGAATSLPACLCFSVRDIAKAESCDTDVKVTRDRRVQRFTVALVPGALVYTAKSTSDIFESAAAASDSTVSSANSSSTTNGGGGGFSLAPVSATTNPSCLRPLPSGGCSCAFIFYQGGITRCVTSLRKYSPKMLYTCFGTRHNNNNSISSALSMAGDSGVSANTLSRAPSTQWGTQEFYPVDVDGSAAVGTATSGGGAGGTVSTANPSGENNGGTFLEMVSTPSMQSSATLGKAQQTAPGVRPTSGSGGGGWRSRLSAAGLFGHSKHAASSSSDQTHSFLHWASPTASLLTGGAAETSDHAKKQQQQQGLPPDRQTAFTGGASRGPAGGGEDGASGGRSSNSSFEDLTDEMTAVRLGACYVPPKPSLPHVEADASAVCVTVAEWEATHDAAPVADTTTTPSSASAASSPLDIGGMTARNRERVLSADRWPAFRQSLFERGGLADGSIRFEVWCYLLGAYAVGSTAMDRQACLLKERELYERLTTQWKSFLPEQEEHFAVYRYAKHSILKDVERTDRTHPAFRDDNSDMLRVLQELLLAHVMYNMDLGYSQGMSDVAAVASLVAPPSDEPAMFLCLRKMLSEHMASNFVIEERKKDAPYRAVKGLQRKLYQVQVLTRHFHPRLYGHLKMRCMAEDMTFCFRWLLVCFKRDLASLDDTMRFWDVLFACPYTKSYEVVVTVALLVALAPQIITHVHAYETLLQFMNVLSSGTSVDQILHCAREFYENVCVVETRELRRRHQHAIVHAAAAKAQEPLPEWDSGGRAKSTATAEGKGAADSDHYPTVEEMVLLFLETDGPL
jgi:hypothetical protein